MDDSDVNEGVGNTGQLVLNVRGDFNPASLIGRQISKQYVPNGPFYVGEIVSFRHPDIDDAPDIAAQGVFYMVAYEDGDHGEYNIEEIRSHLIQVGRDFVNLVRGRWNQLKAIYKALSLMGSEAVMLTPKMLPS